MTPSSSNKGDDAVKDFFAEFNAIDWRTYTTFSALSGFELFWRDTEGLVIADADRHQQEHGPKWSAETEEEIGELFAEIRAIRAAHDEVITPTFRYAAVITLFAIFERELRRTADTIAAQQKTSIEYRNLKTGLFKHVRNFVRTCVGFDLSEISGVERIHDLQKIRDCLVHCYGDAALSRDRAHLIELSKPAKGLEIEPGMQMVIEAVFIEQSLEAIRSFFAHLFIELEWIINDRWHLKAGSKRKPKQ